MLEIKPLLETKIYSRKVFETEESAREVVELLLKYPEFRPDRFGEYEPYHRLTSESIDLAVAAIANRAQLQLSPHRRFSRVGFSRTRRPRCSYDVAWSLLCEVAFEQSWYLIEEGFCRQPDRLEAWLGFCIELLALHEAWYASFALEAEKHPKNLLEWRHLSPYAANPAIGVRTLSGVGVKLEQGIPGIYWGNYLSAFYVDWFGRDRLETLPCIEKRWLPGGGLFFTTAPTPFDWDRPETRELQQAVKEHLGAEAFFDIESVKQVLAELEPIPERMAPEELQSPRRVPKFPFVVVPYRPSEQEMEETIDYLVTQGFTVERAQGNVVELRDAEGGKVRITFGPNGSVEHWPKSQL